MQQYVEILRGCIIFIVKKNDMQIQAENHLDKEEARWFAVRTKFRDEKVAVKELEGKQIEAYLPIKQMLRTYGRKKRLVEMPLINSHLFVKIVYSQYEAVISAHYVTGFVKIGKNLLSIPSNQIELMRKLLGEGYEVEASFKELVVGVDIEVESGPLMGMRGKLVSWQGKDKVVIDLDNFEYHLAITIDSKLLKRV